MASVIAGITTSIDGYITGPGGGPGMSLGDGGERLPASMRGATRSYRLRISRR